MANVIVETMNETTMEREGSRSENGELENTNAEVAKQMHSETVLEGESMERIETEAWRITKIRCERHENQRSSTFQGKSSKIQTRTTTKRKQKDQESDTFIIRTNAQLRRFERTEYAGTGETQIC